MIQESSRLDSPKVGAYLVQNPWSNRLLSVIDSVLRRFTTTRSTKPISKPRRLLLCNGAHLGDVLVATSILPFLRDRLPDTEIGFQIGSWSLPVLKGNPHVERIHIVDHWYHNRKDPNLLTRFAKHRESIRIALPEIKAAKYDAAVDLYCYFGNSIPLIHKAGIPIRIGYTSGGFGPLLTHPKEWVYADRHISEYQIDLLKALPVRGEASGSLRYSLAHATLNNETALPPEFGEGPYVVFHMGTGLPLKEWPAERWRSLTEKMVAKGTRIFFTGVGAREEGLANEAMNGLTGCMNWCNRLDWRSFLTALRGARLIICADSLAAHVAAAFQRPSVVLATGINNVHHWKPLSPCSFSVTRSVPCAPCFQKRGCEGMECIREVGVDEVFSLAMRLHEEEAP